VRRAPLCYAVCFVLGLSTGYHDQWLLTDGHHSCCTLCSRRLCEENAVDLLVPNKTYPVLQGEGLNFQIMEHVCHPILASLVWPFWSLSLGFYFLHVGVCVKELNCVM
jgi:hypothetical protein